MAGFLMIPLTTLYNDCLERPKLIEQKKYPFEYILPSPIKWVGIAIELNTLLLILLISVSLRPFIRTERIKGHQKYKTCRTHNKYSLLKQMELKPYKSMTAL